MVWGVRCLIFVGTCSIVISVLQWVVASLFVLCIGMAIAELASAAPTAGGVSGLHK